MILKRPSFRRGGNSGIAMLRQRYRTGTSYLNPGEPKTIQDFYKDRAEKMQETSKGIGEFIKAKPRGPGTFRGYKVPAQPQPMETVTENINVDMTGDPAQFTGEDTLTDFEALKKGNNELEKALVGTSSVTLDPKEEIAKGS